MSEKYIMRYVRYIILILLLCILSMPTFAFAAWEYDWSVRTDRHNKPAGIFATTPFPIDENTASYTIQNDEYPNGRTFILGTKYYVDGGYTGGESDGSWNRPWTDIATAVANVSSGNKTIIVRGAHDAFNGVYTIGASISLSTRSGINDTQRYMVVGYGHERPAIDGGGTVGPIVAWSGGVDAYFTLQRLTLRNSSSYGFLSNGYNTEYKTENAYINLIDIETTDCDNSSIYLMYQVDNGWIFHCTAHDTHGHGIKVGDGASICTVEWSHVYNCGMEAYGIGTNAECGIDFPVDNATPDAHSNICRYNIIHHVFAYGIQFRYQRDFSAHHNEIYNCGYQVRDAIGGVLSTTTHMNVLIYQSNTSGNFYSNIIRDAAYSNGMGIYCSSINGVNPVNIYDNLFYGMTANTIYVNNNCAQAVNINNNSFYQNDSDAALFVRPTPSGTVTVNKNIFYQAGSGACADINAGTVNDFNLYYYPNGSKGANVDGSNDIVAGSQNFWTALPSGAWSSMEAALTSTYSAAGIGAAFLQAGGTSVPEPTKPPAPGNLRPRTE